MCRIIWLLSRKYGTAWYHPASSKLCYLTALSFVNFQEKLTGTSFSLCACEASFVRLAVCLALSALFASTSISVSDLQKIWIIRLWIVTPLSLTHTWKFRKNRPWLLDDDMAVTKFSFGINFVELFINGNCWRRVLFFLQIVSCRIQNQLFSTLLFCRYREPILLLYIWWLHFAARIVPTNKLVTVLVLSI
jgi:hypothetical protein